MLSDGQVMSVVEDKGFFSSKKLFEFVGLIKINPNNKGSIVPLISNSITNATYIYYITRASDSEGIGDGLKVKRILERTANGVIRRVNGIDYSRCQGVGLFVSTDPSYVDPDSWTPGMANPFYPHWMASSTYGEWVPEPGYAKSSSFGDALGKVEWCPAKTYLNGKVRAGECPGEWQIMVDCSSCRGTGRTTRQTVSWRCSICNGSGRLKRKLRCERCSACNWKGYQWSSPYPCTKCNGIGTEYRYDEIRCSKCGGKRYRWEDVRDPNMIDKLLVLIKSGLKEGSK